MGAPWAISDNGNTLLLHGRKMGSNPILSISVRGVIGSTAGFQPASKGSSPFGRFCLVGSLMAKRLTVNQELMVRIRPFQLALIAELV